MSYILERAGDYIECLDLNSEAIDAMIDKCIIPFTDIVRGDIK